MPKTIRQSVTLPASAKALHAAYLSPKSHGGFTGAPVKIGRKPGTKFSAFGGALSGRILQVVPGRLIVQSWRSTNFAKDDMDSTLVLSFHDVRPGKARIDMVHVNVSDQDAKDVRKGWRTHYWTPWREWLTR